jgi:hypothetical protein
MFLSHLQREEKGGFRIGDFGNFRFPVELVGRADELSEGKRLSGDVPTKAGGGDTSALQQRDQATTKIL